MPVKQIDAIKETRKFYGVDPKQIVVQTGWNPRTDFSGEEELMNSIIENGVKRPLILKRDKDNNLVLIDGERRLRAVLRAIEEGHEILTIPAFLEKPTTSESESLFDAIIANDSKPFQPLEEAEAFKRLVSWGHKPEDIAKKIGKSITHVINRITLNNASPELKEAIKKNEIKTTLATNIVKASAGKEEEQKKFLQKAKTSKDDKREVVAETKTKKKEKNIQLIDQIILFPEWSEISVTCKTKEEAKDLMDTTKNTELRAFYYGQWVQLK